MVGFWNGGQIVSLTPANANLSTFEVIVQAIAGINKFTFSKAASTNNFTLNVQNVYLSDNLFINGGFEHEWNGWTLSGVGQRNSINEWFHNKKWLPSNGIVCNLDVERNENYTQTFSLSAGTAYRLKFQYAADYRKPASSSAMIGYWNGAQIINYTPISNVEFSIYEIQVVAV